MKLTRLFTEFFESERAGGMILIFCTAASLLLANSALSEPYLNFWQTNLGEHTIAQLINDGLMTIFFLLIGLELEREIYIGELSGLRNAALPLVAAIGGMLVPASVYFCMNAGTPTLAGTGIPMATDIAFAIGVLSLLGSRVPVSLKILLTALAVIDDLGAIIVISVFYTSSISLANLFISLGIFGFLLLINRLKVLNLLPYLAGGIAMWYFMWHSGVHPTITGVLLAFAIPFGSGKEPSPSYILQHILHKPIAFIILPLFALANTCLVLDNGYFSSLGEPGSMGIIAGLTLGKPMGIFIFSYGALVTGICTLPEGVKMKHLFGIGLLGGIGFTMSIFISLLAYTDPSFIDQAKLAILFSSIISGILGFLWLKFTLSGRIADGLPGNRA
jgi:NhaA family Na+:H+ antiporter